jgi:hypothetical protein
MNSRIAWVFAAIATAASVSTMEHTVLACGGCVHVPGPAPSSVTEHRMVLALSSRQTTLWDQFSYAGNPSEFAWILPIRHDPSVRVAVADDRFLAMFDQVTEPILNEPPPPPPRCPTTCPDVCWRPPPFADASASQDASVDSSVVVHRMEVVGPYAVAIIGGDDAMALRRWLRDNGYAVPASIEPVLDHYIGQRMDFVALRLRSAVGVNRMVPVRVTVPGYVPVLPLRMVQAGVGDKVGLNLMVFADARIEAMNYPNGEMNDAMFSFDYARQSWPPPTWEHLNVARRALWATNMRRTWITESAARMSPDVVRAIARDAERTWRSQACGEDGGVPQPWDFNCGGPRASEDADVALTGLGANTTLTRLTADLPSVALSADLQLGPRVADVERSRVYQYGQLLNRPSPPVCTPLQCPTTCDGGVSMDAARPSGDSGRLDGSARGPLVASGGVSCSIRGHQRLGAKASWLVVIAATFAARRARRAARTKR